MKCRVCKDDLTTQNIVMPVIPEDSFDASRNEYFDICKACFPRRRCVFLGGTCNKSTWRENLINLLDENKVSWFNPVVEDWDDGAYQQELYERKHCGIVLFVITPKMTGVYAIAEAVDDSNKRPERTAFMFLHQDENISFNKGQLRSLDAVRKMIEQNGGKTFDDLEACANYLNSL